MATKSWTLKCADLLSRVACAAQPYAFRRLTDTMTHRGSFRSLKPNWAGHLVVMSEWLSHWLLAKLFGCWWTFRSNWKFDLDGNVRRGLELNSIAFFASTSWFIVEGSQICRHPRRSLGAAPYVMRYIVKCVEDLDFWIQIVALLSDLLVSALRYVCLCVFWSFSSTAQNWEKST